jgi:cytoskeleton protein RodZ
MAKTPAAPAKPAMATVAEPTAPAAEASAAGKSSTGTAGTASPSAGKSAAKAPSANAGATVSGSAAPATSAAANPAATGPSRVVLTAVSDDCWIQIREMDGRLLTSRLLRKGDVYDVPNRAGLTLTVGNAGALKIAVDGKALPFLGAKGQVRRNVNLDPAALQRHG